MSAAAPFSPAPRFLWVRGGTVVCPATGRCGPGDLFARRGQLVAELTAEERAEATVLDATGLVVLPGLVDLRCHLCEPGYNPRETIATGTRAAAAAGFTTVVAMPNTLPPVDSSATVQQVLDIAAREAWVRVLPTGHISAGGKGERLAGIGSLQRAGVVAITDSPSFLQSNELMRRALEYARMFQLVTLDFCQEGSLSEGGVMHEGEWSLRLGLRGLPAAAEELAVSRNVVLAAHTGARLHLQGISSAGAVEILRRAKARGVPVTAETTPNHLALTDAALAIYDSRFKTHPPLRTEADRQALLEGVASGLIDNLASGHAPFTTTETEVELDRAPVGVAGLQSALPVAWMSLRTALGDERALPLLAEAMSLRPARVLGLPYGTLAPGAVADFVLFDPTANWTPNEETLYGRSRNSPWVGQTLTGRVHTTVVAGHLVWQEHRFQGRASLRSPVPTSTPLL